MRKTFLTTTDCDAAQKISLIEILAGPARTEHEKVAHEVA